MSSPLPHTEASATGSRTPYGSTADRTLWGRTVALFTQQEPRRPLRSFFVVLGTLILIGALDYATGVRISLNLFYVVPILLCDNWLGWRAATLTAIASVLIRSAGDYLADPTLVVSLAPTLFWNRLVDFAVYLALLGIFHAHIALRRQLEQRVRQRTVALEQAVAARQQLQTQLFEISRRERSSIGRDLHDDLGQHLTGTAMAAEVLAHRLNHENHSASRDAEVVAALLQESISKTREIARGLLLAAIEPEELVSELEELAATTSQNFNIACRFRQHGSVPTLDAAQASHLFYIAQEAVRNALRHGKPSHIEIEFTAQADAVLLAVTDNGTGIDISPSQQASGMGLRIMAHRAELIGASFQFGPGTLGGTSARCRLPLRTPAQQEAVVVSS